MNRASQVTSRPSHVQERLIGALIPDALGTRTESPSVPLPVLPTLSRLDDLDQAALLVSTTRMDHSGRIHERILLRELGWEPGTCLDMDTMHGMILIAATPAGHHRIDHRGAIKLPAAFPTLVRDPLRPAARARGSYTRSGGGRSPSRRRREAARRALHRPHPHRPGPQRTGSRPQGPVMTAQLDRLAAARQALAELGVTVAELHDNPNTHHMPTLGEYLPKVIAAAGPGANRTYGTYWARMATTWGHRRLDELLASDIEAMKNTAAKTARSRRSSRHGRHAGEHVVAAARAIYNRAIADDLIDHKASPAHRVAKPRRLPNTRRALTAWELEQINATARISGNDAILDALLLRLHTETACRRGGALAIRLQDLDTDRCLVKLREKGSTVRWQPITPALTNCLIDHAAARGAKLPTDPLLRFRNGHPLTSRRYDHLWKRLGDRLPWVATQGISTHWLRHTTLTWIERHFGYGVARAYAGHTDNTGPATTTYIKASLQEVATALATMTGQPHPMADP